MLLTLDDPIWDLLKKYSDHIENEYEDNWYYHLKDLTGIKNKELSRLQGFNEQVLLTQGHYAFDNYELAYPMGFLKSLDKETVAQYKEIDEMFFSKVGRHLFPNYEVLYQK